MTRTMMALLLAAVPVVLAVHAPPAASLRGGAQRSLETKRSPRKSFRRRDLQDEGTSGKIVHLGCYKDTKEDRVLGSMLVDKEGMTPETCQKHCETQTGAAFMALQYGQECWCARRADLDYERHGVGTCASMCTGEPGETCGGRYAFDLYQLDWASASEDAEYMECYMDDKSDRVMSDKLEDPQMTQSVCRAHCLNHNAMYYATQYGNECWCGASSNFKDYDKHGLGVCHMPCSGDDTVACGGYHAFSLFRFMDNSGDSGPSTEPVAPNPSPTAVPMTPSPTKEETPIEPQRRDSPTPQPSMASPTSEPTMVAPSPEPTMAAPTPESTPTPDNAPTDNGDGGGGSAGDYSDLLAIHNMDRCMHNADPLTWDDSIARVAKDYANVLTNSQNCGDIFHSSNEYGENLYMCGATGSGGCYNAKKAMQGLYNDEVDGKNNVEDYGGHATAILWKATKRIGCAVSTCKSGDYNYETLVCNFDPPGNNMSIITENVDKPSKSAAQCGG